jgi:CheY-like chemotaxis protein
LSRSITVSALSSSLARELNQPLGAVLNKLGAAQLLLAIIFITAINDDAMRKEAIAGGCVAYLRKPFAPHLLLDAIARVAA